MITYAKLQSGDWGLKGSSTELSPNAWVIVERKGGSRSRVQVGRVIWTGQGVALATIAGKDGTATAKTAPQQMVPQQSNNNGMDSAESLLKSIYAANHDQLLMIRQIVNGRLEAMDKPAMAVTPIAPVSNAPAILPSKPATPFVASKPVQDIVDDYPV